MSQPWVATVHNTPRTKDALPDNPAYQRTAILKEAPALGRIVQTKHGGRPSS